MVKIICIADTHGLHRQLQVPDGDVLIHAGDIQSYGYANEVEDFNAWLGELPHRHKIVIAGNHDRTLYEAGYEKVAKKYITNATYLENSGCTIEGINFWGSPITPTFNNWYFMAERDEEIQNKYWSKITRNTDVLIVHGPPYGIRDEAVTLNTGHVGCSDLLWTVKQLKPRFCIFGHIHSAHGITKTKDTIFVNASVLDEEYKITYKPTEIKL